MARFLVSLLAAAAFGAFAQERYPVKPVQMVVPLSPGTTVDIIARLYADRLTQRLGQAVIVQNRPGAGGTIAAQSVAASAADGYTILMANTQHSVNPALYANLAYNILRDFAGVAMVAEAPALVYVNPGLGARTLAEFVALAKAKPGTINYGSAGVGTATHLGGAYFASQAKIDIVHVPYKVTPDLVSDIVTGRIQATFSDEPRARAGAARGAHRRGSRYPRLRILHLVRVLCARAHTARRPRAARAQFARDL